MADYYLAPSLVSFRNEVNAANPNRDTSSDGWIGDKSHAARKSDHNPDWDSAGVVRALDIDKDGVDPEQILALAIKDPRVEYVIWNGFIYLRSTGFRKQVYTGPNKHTGHIHLSLRHTKTAEKSGKWGYNAVAAASSGKTAGDVVVEVMAGKWGSGDDRVQRLRNAGWDPIEIQVEVNKRVEAAANVPAAPALKSISVIAKEVIAGQWSNGPTRSQRLTAAGYSPVEVQAEVNRQMGGGPVRPSVSLLATQVIAGQWGSGLERARRLSQAGFDAKAVQAEVNRRLK